MSVRSCCLIMLFKSASKLNHVAVLRSSPVAGRELSSSSCECLYRLPAWQYGFTQSNWSERERESMHARECKRALPTNIFQRLIPEETYYYSTIFSWSQRLTLVQCRRLHKSLNTRRWWSLRNILSMATTVHSLAPNKSQSLPTTCKIHSLPEKPPLISSHYNINSKFRNLSFISDPGTDKDPWV